MEGRINSFRGKYAYLSNFYEDAPLMLDGLHFRNSEAAYQAGKTRTLRERMYFTRLSPDEAKQLGKTIDIRPDWDQVKESYMRRVVHAKFTQNPRLALDLLQTAGAVLEEGNTWHDNFFGRCYCAVCGGGRGQNILGQILMHERAQIGAAVEFAKMRKEKGYEKAVFL